MSDNEQGAPTLSDAVAEEVRVLLTRRRMSGRELARKLHKSASWVSYRLTGSQPIDLNDLQLMAEALNVEPADLMPRGRSKLSCKDLGQRIIATVGLDRPRRTTQPRRSVTVRRQGVGRSVSQTRPLSPLLA